MKKLNKAQNLLEYILIFAMVAVIAYGFTAKINFTSLKNSIFGRPADSSNPSQITIEEMTK